MKKQMLVHSKFLWMLLVECVVLSLSLSHIHAQSIDTTCSRFGLWTNSPPDYRLYYIKSTTEHREIWVNHFEPESIDTGYRLARRASNLQLSPDGNRLAFTTTWGSEASESGLESQLGLLNMMTGRQEILFQEDSGEVDFIFLHWLDNERLAFISNYQNREYSIINLEGQRLIDTWPDFLDVGEHNEDWFLSFSNGFTYAAFPVNLSNNLPNEVNFLNIETQHVLNISIPNPWVNPGFRDYTWSLDNQTFLILDMDFDWQAYSFADDRVYQITDVSESFYLRRPAIAPNMNGIAFEAIRQPFSRPNVTPTLAIWHSDLLVDTCQYGLLSLTRSGWDMTGQYFAFFINNQNGHNLYVLDTDTNSLFLFDTALEYDEGATILGWR